MYLTNKQLALTTFSSEREPGLGAHLALSCDRDRFSHLEIGTRLFIIFRDSSIVSPQLRQRPLVFEPASLSLHFVS